MTVLPRVVFMCGPAGAGKSTYARRLEADGWVRLSVDTEAWRRGAREQPLAPDLHAEIVTALKARLLQCVSRGEDVVVDLSFWSRAMRDEWRALLEPAGVVPEIVHVATDRETCLRRLEQRRGEDADDVVLPRNVGERYVDHFEPPGVDEGVLTVVVGEGTREA